MAMQSLISAKTLDKNCDIIVSGCTSDNSLATDLILVDAKGKKILETILTWDGSK